MRLFSGMLPQNTLADQSLFHYRSQAIPSLFRKVSTKYIKKYKTTLHICKTRSLSARRSRRKQNIETTHSRAHLHCTFVVQECHCHHYQDESRFSVVDKHHPKGSSWTILSRPFADRQAQELYKFCSPWIFHYNKQLVRYKIEYGFERLHMALVLVDKMTNLSTVSNHNCPNSFEFTFKEVGIPEL